MTIKADRWIREMSEQHGMIEPYEPGQVRESDGQKLISYGTSSYGYDVRCSRQFKVFTNINSATVDPKNFDEGSFVDVEDDVCIIPPNSFALASTVEYFRTQPHCLPKSTRAKVSRRCCFFSLMRRARPPTKCAVVSIRDSVELRCPNPNNNKD